MPFDRDVTIDFNADISGYSASMGQMIQQTSQYSAAADGMIGQIAKLNNVTMAGVKSLSAFTQTNKVATAQAAAYQQQLSKIETSAKVNNKSFKELEKTTKGLAKDFPIGMQQAVKQVESLQEAGVTSNKEINQLAKTFTKLGAATGTFGPEMGQNMLQLNRTFENGTDSMEKYADSLTTVTHQYGANAGAVTSFAKSIAPVAATVGMSETSVIGLSTAFSRLGEDGFAAANTFNKVMLDMSKSIREGTPEAKVYAEVMGTTAENLQQTWKTNPAEGFIDFVEAIKAQGAGGIRSLEKLGLEGVRTQKTIMALANSGNMREIVATAQSAYGSGSTGAAAETAMGGVNDQMTMLNETMAQTVSTAGKPFLGFLEDVLGVANSLSRALSSLVESDIVQGLAKVVGIGGGLFAATKLLNKVMPTVALGHLGARAAGGQFAAFRAGRAGEWGEDPSQAPLATRIGAAATAYLGPSSGVPGETLRQRVGRGARTFANVGGNIAALSFRSQESLMLKAMGEEGLSTAEGKRFTGAMDEMRNIDRTLPRKERRAAAKLAAANAASAVQDMAMLEGGVGRAMKQYASQTKTSVRYAGSLMGMGARGLGAVGGQMAGAVGIGGLGLGASAALGGVGLAAGAGYMLYQSRQKEEKAQERGGQNAYRMFNEFAEKAGLATKGLVSFADALKESTASIAGESKTREEAYELTAKERIQAQTPGYERAYTTRGGSFWDKLTPGGPSAEKEALRVRGMLGANASPEAINRVQMDLANQFGSEFAQSVMTNLSGLDKMSSSEIEDLLSGAGDKSRALGIFGTTESAEFKEMAEAERARRVNVERSVKGADLMQVEEFAAAEEGLATLGDLAKNKQAATQPGYAMGAQAGSSAKDIQANTEAIDDLVESQNLSTEEEQALRATIENPPWAQAGAGGYGAMAGQPVSTEPKDWGDYLEASGLTDRATAYRQGVAEGGVAEGGYANISPEKLAELTLSPMEKAAKESTDRMSDLEMETGTLAKDLGDTSKAYRDWTKTAENADKTFEEWVEAGSEGATDLQKAYAAVKMAPGDVAKQATLTAEVVQAAVDQAITSGGGAVAAGNIVTSAMTTETGEELPALQAARAEAMQRVQLQAPTSTFQQTTDVINQGKRAEAALQDPKITASQRAQFEADKKAGLDAQTARMQQLQAFQLQQRRAQEDFNKQRSYMEADFQRSQAYAAEDYGRQRKYMIQDYHRSVERAEKQFYKQRARAQRDFDKQIVRQSEETAKSMFDPYQRIGPQMVTDMAVLTQSLIEQNQSVRDQLESVDQLAAMGLSKDAIDQLKLMDPSQNQQVQRMLADAMSNPQGINEINSLIQERLRLGTELTTSDYNKGFQNMKDDFKTSLDDMAADFEESMDNGHEDFKRGLRRNGEAFATAQSRAAEQHQQALDRMDEANTTARDRAIEDLTGMAEEYTDNYVEIEAKFLDDLAKLPSNLSPATKQAITKVLQDEIDAIEAAHTNATSAGGAAASAASSAYAMGSGERGAGPGPDTGSSTPGDSSGGGDHDFVSFFLQRIGDSKIIGKGAGHKSPTWHEVANACLQNVAWAKRYLGDTVKHTGYPTAWSVGNAIRGERKMHGGYDAPAGALYWWDSSIGGGSGHVAVADGKGNAVNNWGSARIEKHAVRGMSSKAYRGWSSYSALAEGGIVAGPTRALIGEAGREAVIPLNDKGTRYLADALSAAARYWQPTEAAGTRSQGYSSPVTNNIYTYDQRTQFSGEVHVESQDPEAMAKKLADRKRRNRLARKQGSAA